MKLFARRPSLPDVERAALALGRREHVLAFQRLDGGIVVATDHRIAVVDGEGAVVARPWHEAESAVWDLESKTLRVRWVDGSPTWTLAADEPDRDLMTTVRARIQSTLVTAQSDRVGGRTLRVALRRDLATDELMLQHQYAQGMRADDPRVAAAVVQLEARIRDDVGLPDDFA